MESNCLSLFDTALGRCGIAWGKRGIVSVSFPEECDEETCARLRRRAVGAVAATPPDFIEQIISDIKALFVGGVRSFEGVRLDREGQPEFDLRVFDETSKIGPGETKTYGDIARALGDIALSRRVGQALGRNPFPIIVPCHRVVGAKGNMTGFSAPGGTETKYKLLKIEGALEPDLFD